jgi:hypothetical protein
MLQLQETRFGKSFYYQQFTGRRLSIFVQRRGCIVGESSSILWGMEKCGLLGLSGNLGGSGGGGCGILARCAFKDLLAGRVGGLAFRGLLRTREWDVPLRDSSIKSCHMVFLPQMLLSGGAVVELGLDPANFRVGGRMI